MGGCEVSVVMAIDFTGSNGDPATPASLHYLDRSGAGRLNQYQQAILSVGNVVEPYDTDKMFPVYGFGARVRLPNGQFSPVQHCFPVYGGGLEVQGINGIMQVSSLLYVHLNKSESIEIALYVLVKCLGICGRSQSCGVIWSNSFRTDYPGCNSDRSVYKLQVWSHA